MYIHHNVALHREGDLLTDRFFSATISRLIF